MLAQQPTQAEARIGRGDALLALQRLDEALSEFDRVIQAQPQNTGAWTRRGAALSQLGRAEDAIAAFSRALEMKPEDAETLDRRGNMYLMLRRFEEAARDFSRTLALDPDFPWTHGNLAYCRLHCCDWAILEASSAAILRAARDGRLACAPLQYLSVAGFDGNTSEVQAGALSQARAFVQHQYPPSLQPLWRGERYAHDRIRLAYLSADFNDHAVARLIAGVFECHDRSRFETIGVSLRPDDRSPMRRRLEAAFDTFRDVRGLGDAEVAAWLRASEVDVAIDLNGFTSGCRPGILARRPAPVQAQFLGFPGTMGAPYIDYLIADEGVVPPDQRRHYQEKIVCLPRPYLPADARRATPGATPSRAKAGLPETGFVFCCFSGLFKITPTMFGVWMRLLLRVEDSVLWLPSGNSAALSALQGEAQRRGVDPRRLIFASFTATAEEHLSRLQLADLFLDTLPYNAHATACDALWAGVPLLTLEGASFAGRVAASALKGVGLDELITRTVEDYEALALALARDPARLRGLREKLRQARVASPLFDTQGFTRDLEAAIAMMCERQRRGEPPESFAVGQAGRGPA